MAAPELDKTTLVGRVAYEAQKARKCGQSFHTALMTGMQKAEDKYFVVEAEPALAVARAILQANPTVAGATTQQQQQKNIGGKHGGSHHRHHKRHHRRHQRPTGAKSDGDDGDCEPLFRLTLGASGQDQQQQQQQSCQLVYSVEDVRTMGANGRYLVVDDHTVQVLLHCQKTKKSGETDTLIPTVGTWRLGVHVDSTSATVATTTIERGGKYDLAYNVGNDPSLYYTLRVPVFGAEETNKLLAMQFGITELHLTVQPVRGKPDSVRLVRGVLVLFTHADERWFGFRTQTMSVTPTPDTTFASFFRGEQQPVERPPFKSLYPKDFQDLPPYGVNKKTPTAVTTTPTTATAAPAASAIADASAAPLPQVYEPLSSQGVEAPSRPGVLALPTPTLATAEQVGPHVTLANLVLGEGSRFHSEMAAFGVGAHMFLHEESAPSPSGKTRMFRLGEISSALSAMAMVGHMVETQADKSTLNLHDPALTARMLDASGATHIRAALERCYAQTGSGRLPTLSELFNHTSGLPAELPLSHELAARVAQERTQRTSASNAHQVESMLSAQHDYVARAIGERVVPLFEPGARASYSPLGYAVLRYCVDGWQQDGPERMVEARLREMGFDHVSFMLPNAIGASIGQPMPFGVMTSANEGATANGNANTVVAPCFIDVATSLIGANAASATQIDSMHRERVMSLGPQGLYNLACGLYADMPGLARVFSDALPWYGTSGTANAGTSVVQSRYAYIGQMLQPRATIDKQAAIFTGYSLEHVPIEYHGRQLRAVVKVGQVRGAHTTVLATVPALHLSAAFSTNADPTTLAQHYASVSDDHHHLLQEPDQASLAPFVSHMVGYVLDRAPAKSMVYDSAMEHLLSFKPAESPSYAQMRVYNKRVTKRVFEDDAALQRVVGKPFVGTTFYALAETANHLPAETLTLCNVDANDVFDDANTKKTTGMSEKQQQQQAARALVLQMGVECVPNGPVVNTMHAPLAFDTRAVDPYFAHQEPQQGKAVSGALRMLEPHTGFVGEFISLAESNGSPVLSFRGQLYVPKSFLEQQQQAQLQQQQKEQASVPRSLLQSALNKSLAEPQQFVGAGGLALGLLGGAALGGLAGLLLAPTFYGPRYYHVHPYGYYGPTRHHRRYYAPYYYY